jgi:ABC-2 type transport system ATP-binding protein
MTGAVDRPADGRDTVVAFDTVSKSYGQVRALRGISFQIHEGETVALLGPNGAGKSTTLDLMLGLRRPDGGTVALFDGTAAAAIRAGRVGAMLQSGGLMPDVKVGELVTLVHDLGRHPLPVPEVLDRAGITEIVEQRVDRLSGGQTQRVRFALAIADNPDFIVLDEPTAGMDVETRNHFWVAMRDQAAAGRTVLFATHYLEEADGVADRILVVHRGRLLADTTPSELKASAGLRRITFRLPDVEADALRALPGVTDVAVHRGAVQIRSNDSDATVEAIYLSGLRPRDFEVAGLGLEQAFLAITAAADEAEGVSDALTLDDMTAPGGPEDETDRAEAVR